MPHLADADIIRVGDEYQADIPVWGEGGGVAAVDARQGLVQGSGQGLAYELIHTADADGDNDEQSHQHQQQQQYQGIGSLSPGDIIVVPSHSGNWDLCCVISIGSATGAIGDDTTGSSSDEGTGTDIDSDNDDSGDNGVSSTGMFTVAGTMCQDREGEGEGKGGGRVCVFDGMEEQVVSIPATPSQCNNYHNHHHTSSSSNSSSSSGSSGGHELRHIGAAFVNLSQPPLLPQPRSSPSSELEGPGQLLSFADLQLFLNVTGQGRSLVVDY